MTTEAETGTAVINWEEELAKQAEAAAAAEPVTGGGQFFSIKSGILQFDGQPLPGNQACVIIVDAIYENVFYGEEYDPDSPQGPTCFAFGRADDEMAPHELVVAGKGTFEAQHEECEGCPMNEWGSASRGKGKACRNTRRLALLPAGTYDNKGNLDVFDDLEHFQKTALAYLKLPVTSVKGYATFVSQTAAVLKRPPHAVLTRVSVVPDPKTQFKVLFEALDKVPNELIPTLMERHQGAKALIDFPYSPDDGQAQKADKPAKKRKY